MDKIDIVIAWVDGSDPKWQSERAQVLPNVSFSDQRYRDWGLLKYWFRGIDQYAPWVNKIYFVTWGHVPDFLDVNHPKLKIVKHKDYMPEEYLPTYSANPIELNFHRIKGLSERFIYFNDDMYLINMTSPEDFFEKGIPKDVAILNPIVPARYDSVSGIMLNDIGIINENFKLRTAIKENKGKWFSTKYGRLNLLNLMFLPWKKAVGLYQQHLPSSLLKSTLEEVWEREYDILHGTSLRKLRDNKQDVNQWLFKEWEVMRGNFIPRSHKFGKYIMVETFSDVDRVKRVLDSKVKTVCINDHVTEDIDLVMESLILTFENRFNEKSSFEK